MQEIGEQRKSEKDIRRFIKSESEMRRECEGIPPSRDCRVSTVFHSRYYCSPGTGQEETKNNPWNARNIANDICDAGHTRLARMSFSNPMKSSTRIHIVRSFDPPTLKSRKLQGVHFFSLLWNERTSLLPNVIILWNKENCLSSSSRTEWVDAWLAYYVERRHIKFFL